MNQEIVRYQNRLDYLFTKRDQFANDPELLAHWARYLCVLTSGFLELSIPLVLRDYSGPRSHEHVSNYVTAQLNFFRSPKMSNIVLLVQSFSKEWAELLEDETEGEIKAAVDSIVNNRHRIAHGQDIGMSFVQLSAFYERAKRVVVILDTIAH